MHVFVYEHLCGGTLAGRPGADALRAEGWAMLRAALDDLARCPGVRAVTLLDPALRGVDLPQDVSIRRMPARREEETFRELARFADFSLVIAPEFAGILAERCCWVEEEKGRLLGPSAEAVRLTGDKLALARQWSVAGVPTPVTVSACGVARPGSFPVVYKPRHGAGSQATFLVRDDPEWALAECAARAEGWEGEMIYQPHVPGRPASVAFLGGPGRQLALPAAEQWLSGDGRFHYRGGSVPLTQELGWRAQRLAERAVEVVPGLNGYFGVDLVLGESADGSADQVLEINPRLTTSYVGLRQLARFNLMEALLAVATGGRLPAWEWRAGPVGFRADGSVEA
jgi:predicted ATP-grasp superfamily ATP-dependent carboligase